MGLYRDHILPRGIDWVMGKPAFSALRRRVAGEVSGTVLEVGFGSGLNLPHYPPPDAEGGGVERLIAIDPATVGRRLARKRLEAAPFPVEFAPLEGAHYPSLETGGVDTILSTWTLCTIPDLDQALAEMRRVLAPDGRLVFLEHGLCPDERIARWQRRLTPLHRLWAGGCRLDVEIDARLSAAGFSIERCENYAFEKAGRLAGWMYEGCAQPE